MKDIYDRLKDDHRKLESLMASLCDTEGDSATRDKLFNQFADLLENHSHAEERTFYSVALSKKESQEKTVHGCKEHQEAADLLDELKETDYSSGGWLQKMKKMQEDLTHHIDEEENKLFPKTKKVLSDQQAKEIGEAFAREFQREKSG